MWTEKLPETVLAAGYLTLDGEAVEGATIVGSPVAGGHKHACNALTDSSGYFELRAFPSKEGAVPGSYQVSVSKTVEVNRDLGAVDLGEDAAHATEDPTTAGLTWVNVLPQRYTNPLESGLTAQIPEDGTSDLKIELTSN